MQKRKLPDTPGGKLLLLGFLALLLLPWPLWAVFHGAVDTANYENRTLAEFPKNVSVEEWPSDFEDWLGDHAPFRNQLMTLNAGVNNLFGTLDSTDVLRGKDGWLFLKDVSDSTSISDYQGLTAPTGEELSTATAALDALQAALAARGSQLVVLYAPAKEGVYAANMPATVPAVNRPTRVQALVSALRADTTVPVVFPQEALTQAAAAQQVYYKYDTHWNEAGAWLAAQQVLEALGLPHGTALPAAGADPAQAAPHDLANISASWKFCTDDVYYTLDAPRAALDDGSPNGEVQWYTGSGDAPMLLVRDSFGAALAPFLAEPFGRSLVIHGNSLTVENLQTRQEEFPKAVVLEVAERFYYTLPTRAATLLEWLDTHPQ